MVKNLLFRDRTATLLLPVVLAALLAPGFAWAHCGGKHTGSHPHCAVVVEPPPPPPPVVIDSISVDWFNNKLTVRGSGLATAGDFFLGGSAALPKGAVLDSALDLPFSDEMAAEATLQGSYALSVDGAAYPSVFIKSQIISNSATGCPCEELTWWPTVPGWGDLVPTGAECLEIVGDFSNDAADIAGTALTNPADAGIYPHFLLGASFLPGDPDNSVCTLLQDNGDLTFDELANERINEAQQFDCAAAMKENICDSVIAVP